MIDHFVGGDGSDCLPVVVAAVVFCEVDCTDEVLADIVGRDDSDRPYEVQEV